MKIAVLFGKPSFGDIPHFKKIEEQIVADGDSVEYVGKNDVLSPGTELLLSVGGDGTYLYAAAMAAKAGVPVLGVNAGRLGFLSENTIEAVAEAIKTKHWTIEERSLISMESGSKEIRALNEIVVHRLGSSMLGISVNLDGMKLPTYWADGLIVSTPSGSTAYSLSAGGPIVLPQSKVLIIVPIAPHNMNVRPLIVPDTSRISIEFKSRDSQVLLSADNNSIQIPSDTKISIQLAQYSLKRVCLNNNSFINALSEKLFWGEDKRNEK